MDYNTIAYKVENGVIVNASIVGASSDLEEGFIRRPYPLGVGFVESFGDFYSSEMTQEHIDNARQRLKDKCVLDLEIYTNTLDDLTSNYPDVNSDGEPLEVPSNIVEQKEQVQKYISYLEELSQQVDILQNPIQYHYKPFGEM